MLSGGRATKVGQNVGTQIGDALLDLSGDGRYQVSYDSVGTGGILEVRDSVTGETRRLDGLTGSITIRDAKVLANGDVVIGAVRGGDSELGYYSWATNSYRTLGTAINGAFYNIAVSADGTTIAFSSTTDFTPGGSISNPGGGIVNRIFTVNIATGLIRSGLGSPGAVSDIRISSDGRYVATSQTIGMRIYDFGENSNTATGVALSLSSADRAFGITNDGMLYYNTASNFSGQNTTGFQQIMSYNIATGVTSRLSNFAANTKDSLTMNADGSALYFTSTASLDNSVSSGGYRQMYRFDLLSPGATQMTSHVSSVLNTTARISMDGGRMFDYQNGNDLYEYDTTGADTNIDLEAGFGSRGNIIASLQSLGGAVRGLGSFTLGSVIQARAALDRMQANLSLLGQTRSVIGAGQSRLSIAYNLSLNQRDEALSASGRIGDADVAGESAELVRRSIQREAATSVLAQANQQPALAISLLR